MTPPSWWTPSAGQPRGIVSVVLACLTALSACSAKVNLGRLSNSEAAAETAESSPGTTGPVTSGMTTSATLSGPITSDGGTTAEPPDDTTESADPICGDGILGPAEPCDDGNLVDGDGCSAACTVEPNLFAINKGTPEFFGYGIATDAWAALPVAPVTTDSQLTNDGTLVYLLGVDNVIYTYEPESQVWDASAIPGPGFAVDNHVNFFEWTDQGFFAMTPNSQELHVYKDNTWSTIDLPARGSCAGSWDRSTNELCIRSWGEMGFQVIDTINLVLVRTITDKTFLDEDSRDGSLSGGFFYTRSLFGPLQKFDVISGARFETGQQPTSAWTTTDTDVATGMVYISGSNLWSAVFQRYDPAQNALTTLAASPLPENGHSLITVMIPPG
jgi:cysteine-rich repeat protein